jgi:hypothetical protein
VSEEVRLQELIAQKEAQNRLLQAENERQSQEIKLLKEKIDSRNSFKKCLLESVDLGRRAPDRLFWGKRSGSSHE